MSRIIDTENLSYFKNLYDERISRKYDSVFDSTTFDIDTEEDEFDIDFAEKDLEYIVNNKPASVTVNVENASYTFFRLYKQIDRNSTSISYALPMVFDDNKMLMFNIDKNNESYTIEGVCQTIGGESGMSPLFISREWNNNTHAWGPWNFDYSSIEDGVRNHNAVVYLKESRNYIDAYGESTNYSEQYVLLTQFDMFEDSTGLTSNSLSFVGTKWYDTTAIQYSVMIDSNGSSSFNKLAMTHQRSNVITTNLDGGVYWVSEPPVAVSTGTGLSCEFAVNSDWTLSGCSIYMGGNDITYNTNQDGTPVWNGNTGIYIQEVTGNVEINVFTYASPAPSYDYSLSTDLQGCYFENGTPAGFDHGQEWRTNVILEDPYYEFKSAHITMYYDGYDHDINECYDQENKVLYIPSVLGNVYVQIYYGPSVQTYELSFANNIAYNEGPGVDILTNQAAGPYNENQSIYITLTPCVEGQVNVTHIWKDGYDIIESTDINEDAEGAASFWVTFDGNIYIEAGITPLPLEPVTITRVLNNVTSDNYDDAYLDQSYSCTLYPSSGELRVVRVYMNGSDVTEVSCSGSTTEASINIDNVDGDIYIFAYAGDPEAAVEFNITYNGEGITWDSDPSSVLIGDTAQASYVVDPGYAFEYAQVYMNNVDITGLATWQSENQINIPECVGDVSINIYTNPAYDYSLSTDTVFCWLENEPEGFMDGDSYNTSVIQEDAGSSLVTAEVTMGGVDITNEVWDESNGTISIPSVNGDVYVHIEYTEPEPETVSVYNILNGVTSSEEEAGRRDAIVGENWFTELNPTTGYPIQSVKVYMGNSDITSTAWYPPEQGQTQGVVEIDNVEGDIYIFAFAGDPSTSFSVTDNSSGGVTFDNLPVNLSVGQGGTYHYSVDPEYEYIGQSAYMNGTDISDLSTWYGDNYIFIPPAVGYIEISVDTDEVPEMSINWNLTDVTASPQPMSVRQGEDFGPILLESTTGGPINVTIMMGEDDVTEWFNTSTNTIESNGGVWEDVSIEAYEEGIDPGEATLTFANMENCVLVQDGEPVENGATFPIGEPLELAVVSQGIGEAEWYCNVLTMDGVNISECFADDGDPASIEIPEVTGDIHIEISCSEHEEPDVMVESIEFTNLPEDHAIELNVS